MILSEQQADALVELANIGVSHAATQLSQLLNETITMSVPEAVIIELENLPDHVRNFGSEKTVVYQDMTGCLDGRAYLVYDLDVCGELIQLLLGSLPAIEDVDLSAYEHEALIELANIVISTTISTLADSLSEEIHLSIPYYGRMTFLDAITGVGGAEKNQVLILKTNLAASSRSVNGEVMLVLSLTSLQQITDMLDRLFEVHSQPGMA